MLLVKEREVSPLCFTPWCEQMRAGGSSVCLEVGWEVTGSRFEPQGKTWKVVMWWTGSSSRGGPSLWPLEAVKIRWDEMSDRVKAQPWPPLTPKFRLFYSKHSLSGSISLVGEVWLICPAVSRCLFSGIIDFTLNLVFCFGFLRWGESEEHVTHRSGTSEVSAYRRLHTSVGWFVSLSWAL